MPDWDADSPQLHKNLTFAFRLARYEARLREEPSSSQIRVWHIAIMRSLSVPNPHYVGRFRGEVGLEGYEVAVGHHKGVPSTDVAAQIDQFEGTLQKVITALDEIIPLGNTPKDSDSFNAVIELCAWVHGEWVRIHPFANGNGRTARIWVAYIAMRYGLPPFVQLRPRPDSGYGAACAEAMLGNWQATIPVFRQMLQQSIRN